MGKTYPPRSLLVGRPAKVSRPLTDDEVHNLREQAAKYVAVKNSHMRLHTLQKGS
jgi:carbonic anhydrase/acetyltransferase-like protein (isoleucine patch superfamily)